MSSNVGLLLLTSVSKNATQMTLSAVKKHVNKILYISLMQPTKMTSSYKIPLTSYSRTISNIYLASRNCVPELDVRIIVTNLREQSSEYDADQHHHSFHKSIDVLLIDGDDDDGTGIIPSRTEISKLFNVENIIKLSNVRTNGNISNMDNNNNNNTDLMYDNVVLGGTFDRLHTGHKILLTEAVLRTKRRLVIGVTDTNMVKNKTLHELILPVKDRIAAVIDYLKDIDCTLNYEVVPIQDPFGPTKYDPNLQLIVVSSETLRGAIKVNEIRKENQLPELKIYSINVIDEFSDDDDADGDGLQPKKQQQHSIKEAKISSSNQRMDLLGLHLRKPEYKPNLSNRPYIIGLMGGIASGKSVMIKRFEKFGATVINCDEMAHRLYEPGQLCYTKIIEQFGKHLIDPNNNGKINRKQLAEMVFGNPKQLELLNNIIWPLLLVSVKECIKKLYIETNCQIFIIEAAILLKAGWQNECHEIWSLIISPEEAIKRLKERNGLTEIEAKQRIDSQIDNSTIVEHSNVVFCSQWSYEFTQLQAERAWKGLMDHLKDHHHNTETKSKI